uniref:Uncharacterized protein n=1 Tax=Chromera velia CCMP2878 TaxID=1169474 RepID=A0A0G4HK61_9ALVE|eukprot:Cvel_28439.t1-p1 / transcript=Cvel_28439.t1 / gene=Cvel_28439 / organism=Chromera_velia_CCMP2878 / gene_product=hypothetical protein / transcript_product=hypothetical protein / location=Cvel_scaffold3724:8275-12952(+) / protein_length=197 / sequence_SO=supercontig / SO=protein_coding / is_pseudo=false
MVRFLFSEVQLSACTQRVSGAQSGHFFSTSTKAWFMIVTVRDELSSSKVVSALVNIRSGKWDEDARPWVYIPAGTKEFHFIDGAAVVMSRILLITVHLHELLHKDLTNKELQQLQAYPVMFFPNIKERAAAVAILEGEKIQKSLEMPPLSRTLRARWRYMYMAAAKLNNVGLDKTDLNMVAKYFHSVTEIGEDISKT